MTSHADLPPDWAWQVPPGLDRAARSGEQDRAAGGRGNRLMDLGGGRAARASIALKVHTKTRRIRASLVWSDSGKRVTRYVGEVDGATRQRNLKQAWLLARDQGLVPKPAAPENSWASTPSVRSVMRANRGKDTRPELALRAAIREDRKSVV